MVFIKLKKNEINSEIKYLSEIKEYLVFGDGEFKLVPALCKHEGAPLPKSTLNGCVTCPKHGWILDVKKSKYVNPHNLPQMSTKFVIDEDDEFLYISEKVDKNSPPDHLCEYRFADIEFNDSSLLEFKYINHACAIFQSARLSFVTDPWLFGSAFSTGWFLKRQTPPSAVKDVLNCAYCYISHSHPDHLNPFSLIYLRSLGWNPTFVVPLFTKKDATKQILESFGYTKFILLGNKEAFSFTEHPEVQFEMRFDQSGRNDSGFILRYGNTTLVNLVDAPSLDLEGIQKIDIALVPFANGASGFPVCWEDLFGEEKIVEIKRTSNLSTLNNIKEFCKKYNPTHIIPFAGYFHSPLLEDSRIELLNLKNSPSDVKEMLGEKVNVVNPESNSDASRIKNILLRSSIHAMNISQIAKPATSSHSWKLRDILFERYDDFSKQELSQFLNIQDFRDDIVVEFQACDIDFRKIHFTLLWDFSLNQEVESMQFSEINDNRRYLCIKVRRYSLSYAIKNSLPWEEFSIGFQSRFTRHPNVYNFSFWDYFQNCFTPIGGVYEDLSSLCQDLASRNPRFWEHLAAL